MSNRAFIKLNPLLANGKLTSARFLVSRRACLMEIVGKLCHGLAEHKRELFVCLLVLISIPAIKFIEPLQVFGLTEASVLSTPQGQTRDEAKRIAASRVFAEAETLTKEGSAASQHKAIVKYEEALALYRALGDRSGEANTLNNIGIVYDNLGEKQKALDFYNQTLAIKHVLGDLNGEASTLVNIGIVYDDLGEKLKALDFYSQALSIQKAQGNRNGEASTLVNIGIVYDDLGEELKALGFYNQALLVKKALGDRSGEAGTLGNIGIVYDHLGEEQKALDSHNQALTIWRVVGNKAGETNTLNNIGLVYDHLGDKQKALEFYGQALPIERAVGDKLGEANTLANLGDVYNSLGEKKRALEFYNQALMIERAIGDKSGAAGTLIGMGMAYYDLGESQKALDSYNQALSIKRVVGDKSGEAATLHAIGNLYYSIGESQKALEFYNQALPIERAVGDKSGEAATLNNLMLFFVEQNKFAMAAFYGKRAVSVIQQLRSSNSSLDKELQRSFLHSKEPIYRVLLDILISRGRLPEAQQVLNLFKDQQFFDFNREAQQGSSMLSLTPREALFAKRYEEASKHSETTGQKLSDLRLENGQDQLSPEASVQLHQLEAELRAASNEFVNVLRQAETEFSQPASEKDKVGEIVDTREMQTALRDLNQQTGMNPVAIYTLVAEDNFRALIVTPETISAVSQPIKAEALNQKALQLWALLQSDKYDPTKLAQELYSIIFKPIEAQLPKDTNTILWSLDGNLRYLPIGALHDGKQYLTERYNHVVFTRADRERLTRETSKRWTGLGLGSSQARTVELLGDQISFKALPGVNEELRVIFHQNGTTGVVDGDVLPDEKFTKAAMLAALKQKRPLVHIASHFSFRPGDEARSFLLLGDGSTMTLAEMKQQTDLFAGVQLLTLSACNTAAQQPDANGREIDGFAELAQRLGAASVMATLWPVSDNSTPWLMRDFYQARQRGAGLTKAESLRRAQLALLNGSARTKPSPDARNGASSTVKIVIIPGDGKGRSENRSVEVVAVAEKDAPLFKRDESRPFAHPYYWAPFILIGNWK